MITAAERPDNIGSVSEHPNPRHRSYKTRGKVSASVKTEQEPIAQESPKRKLPRRNHQADINRMIDILKADAEEVKEKAEGDIDLFAGIDEKKTPR